MKYLNSYKLFENENENADNFSKFIHDINPNITFPYSYSNNDIGIKILIGKIISHIMISEDKKKMLIVVEAEGEYEFYKFFHEQDCCEQVYLYDVNGDLGDLIGEVVLQAEESGKKLEDNELQYSGDSGTWTFYKLASKNGYVTLRWLGESNGYYSERVEFVKSDMVVDTHEELEILLSYKK